MKKELSSIVASLGSADDVWLPLPAKTGSYFSDLLHDLSFRSLKKIILCEMFRFQRPRNYSIILFPLTPNLVRPARMTTYDEYHAFFGSQTSK